MAKSIRKQVDAARARKDRAVNVIYACALHGNMKFSECMAQASQDQRTEYEASVLALMDIEQQAVSAGKAFRSSIGSLIWN